MKKHYVMLAGTILLLLLATAVVGAQAKRQFVTIVTGGTAGTYYPVGTIFANLWNEKLGNTGIQASAQSSGGTVENLNMLRSNEAQLGIAMTNLSYFAFNGEEGFKGRPLPKLRFLTALWPDVSQFVVTESSGVKAISDMKSKKFSVGSAGSGTEYSSRMILDILGGVKYTDMVPEYLSYGDASSAMQNGRLAGMNAEGGIPTTAVSEIFASRTPVRLLPINADDYRKLSARIPFYVPVTIPANTYTGQREAVSTVGVKCAIVGTSDLSDDMVYQLVKSLYENIGTITKSHNVLKEMNLQTALVGLPAGVPLHAGAYRYYKEMGLSIPDGLIPPEAKR